MSPAKLRGFGASVLCLVASTSMAGYTAATSNDAVLTPVGSQAGPQPGDTFATATSGGFLSFTGDTPSDPTLTGGDLSRYRYTLNGAVATVDPLTNTVDYTGDYRIFYDLGGTGTFTASDPTVSAGTFNITAAFTPGSSFASLDGALTQTSGPSNPAFRDLSYGGHPVFYTGYYVENDPGVSGTIQGVLRQDATTASTPEPAALSLLAFTSLGLLARRKRAAN